jgi:hypothetical protein
VNRPLLLCALFALVGAACGQKGPPLAPIVYVPRAVTDLAVKRVEGDVLVQFKVPELNTDGSSPADLERVEVYAHTGPLPASEDFLRYGTLVKAIEVREPPPPVAEGATEEERKGAEERQREREKPGALAQGAVAVVSEVVTEKHFEPGPVPPARTPPAGAAKVVERLETDGTVNFELPPARYYAVVGVSRTRNRRGPYAGPVRVPLVPPPDGPSQPEAAYTADAITLKWTAPPEDRAPSQAAAPEQPATDAGPPGSKVLETRGTRDLYGDLETAQTVEPPFGGKPTPRGKPQPPPAPRFGFNVYEVAPQSAPQTPVEDREPRVPSAPLNTSLLIRPTFTDERVEFGLERCYVVRRVEMASAIPIESAPSPPTCVNMVDIFAPAPPKALQSVASGNAVNLIWEAGAEADLAGYEVLRGEAPGDTLAPLTKAIITEPSYADASARRGRTYVYEVIAVDKAGNRSGPSNRVEDIVR